MPNIGTPELVLILVVLVLLVGANRIPRLARSLAEARREFRDADEPVQGDERQ